MPSSPTRSAELAERSGRATKEIAALIAEVQASTKEAVTAMTSGATEVETGTRLAAKSGAALDEIAISVTATRAAVEQIATAIGAMSTASAGVSGEMSEVAAIAEANLEAATTMTASAGLVSRSVESIAAVSEQNSAAAQEVSAATEEMSAQAEEVSASAQALSEMADQLDRIVGRFRLGGRGAEGSPTGDHGSSSVGGPPTGSGMPPDRSTEARRRGRDAGYQTTRPATPRPLRVLVVDDSAMLRRVLQRGVERGGHVCLAAGDGVEALEVFDTFHPDVVISDWEMPRMDGPELCRRVRELASETYPYFIFLTALDQREHILTAMAAGADDYLEKPLDRYALDAALVAASRVTDLHVRLREQRDDLRRLNLRLHGDARRDPLTGLGNRLQLREDLAARIAQPGESGASLAMCDIDFFKRLNDHDGHLAGDEVLAAVAASIRDAVRGGDTVYRYGGEEFLVLLPNAPLDAAVGAVERIRLALAERAIVHPDSDVAPGRQPELRRGLHRAGRWRVDPRLDPPGRRGAVRGQGRRARPRRTRVSPGQARSRDRDRPSGHRVDEERPGPRAVPPPRALRRPSARRDGRRRVRRRRRDAGRAAGAARGARRLPT